MSESHTTVRAEAPRKPPHAGEKSVRSPSPPPREVMTDTVSLRFDETGIELLLEQQESNLDDSDSMASALWPTSMHLCRAMNDGITLMSLEWWKQPRRVLELGSGCGACGLLAAKLGSVPNAPLVLLTDYPQLLPLLTRNAALNALSSRAMAKPLEWGREQAMSFLGAMPEDAAREPFDLIIGSDITAFVQTLAELEATIHQLATAEHTQIILAHHDRGGDVAHVVEVFGARFACERIVPSWQHPAEHMLLRLTKRTAQDQSRVEGAPSDSSELPLDLIRAAGAPGDQSKSLSELKRWLRSQGHS